MMSYAFFECQELQTVDFMPDSKLETIDEDAFENSSIEELTIPSNLIELKQGCFFCTQKLTKIKVRPNNKQYICFDEKMIIRKSTNESENYDLLIYCIQNIESVKIPSFIKVIGEYSFASNKNIQKVEFSNDSELVIIEDYAFSNSSIKSITLPPHLKNINERAFSYCENLDKVEIPANSELHFIGKEAFSSTNIENFTVPLNLIKIEERAFAYCPNLQTIEVPANSKLEIIENSSFEEALIKNVSIPPRLTEICDSVFLHCSKLKTIEFQPNSKIKKIGPYAFSSTSILSNTSELVHLIVTKKSEELKFQKIQNFNLLMNLHSIIQKSKDLLFQKLLLI